MERNIAEWYEGDVIANGVRLHYHRTGGTKPALVIAHGLTDTGMIWSRVARALEQDYDVVIYDRRGHGLSDKPETGYTWQVHAADLAALIAALGLQRPRVIGHSAGAAAATLAAASQSDLMACLILEDPGWGTSGGGWESTKAGMRQWFLGLGSLTREQLIAQRREGKPNWLDEEVVHWAESKCRSAPTSSRPLISRTYLGERPCPRSPARSC